jgi:hypothetical protein
MSNGLRMTLSGEGAMRKNLETVSRDFPLAARRGTREWALEKLAIAVERAPIKKGRLRRSGRVRITIGKRATLFGQKASKEGDISVAIVFGGGPEKVRHAFIVHENHKTHSHYLQKTLLEAIPTAAADIAQRIELKKAALK